MNISTRKAGQILMLILICNLIIFIPDLQGSSVIGGYGELHYNHDLTSKLKMLDFHRFVLFFYHTFNRHWSFVSEVELEHNFVKDGHGELELEQAYIDYHPASWLGFRVGVILPSVGFINEMHEPPTFLSVERPEYAKLIIPTTWFGNGITLYGGVKGFNYKFSIMEGLNADGFSASSGIRGGRQKGYKADASQLLYCFRLDYSGIACTLFGFSYSYNEAISQTTNIPVGIVEFHAKYAAHHLLLTLEYGRIGYGEGDVESSNGFYLDAGYDIGYLLGTKTQVIPWVRWTDLNTAAGVRNGVINDSVHHFKKWMFGLTIKPLPSVVFKADFGIKERQSDGRQTKLFNLGAGYMFRGNR